MIATNIAEAAVSMAEAQAYARVETGEEEALLAGLVRTARRRPPRPTFSIPIST